MEASIPFYPLVVVPVAAAIVLFWRRARWHLAVLRSGPAAGAVGSGLGTHQVARRLRHRPAASPQRSRPRTDARLHLLGLPGAAGHDRQLLHQRPDRDDRRLVLRRLLLERHRLLREPVRGARAGIGHLLRDSTDDHAAGATGADARRLRHPGAHLLHRPHRAGGGCLLVRRRARRTVTHVGHPGRPAEHGPGAHRPRGGGRSGTASPAGRTSSSSWASAPTCRTASTSTS